MMSFIKGGPGSDSGTWCRFFFSAQVGGLTNYVIRHISKYGKYDIITEQPFHTTFANSFSGDLLQPKTCQIVLQY